MNQATKYAVTGVVLIALGLFLNELMIWLYWQTALSISGEYPPPLAPIAGTIFILLVPVGLIFLGYSAYLTLRDYRVEIRKVDSG